MGDDDARAQPGGECGFVEGAFGQAEHLYVHLIQRCVEMAIVEGQEYVVADMRGTLVAVHERVVLGQGTGEAGGQCRQVRGRVAVGEQLLRSRQRRFQQGFIAYADAAAVFGQLPLVDGQGQVTGEPDDHGRVLTGPACAAGHGPRA